MAIAVTKQDKAYWAKVLNGACENIKDDADEIIGDLDRVFAIRVNISLECNGLATYTVEREKYAEFVKAD